jgi:hypothetical protein
VPKLVLLGGPPGVGKTTVLALLEKRLKHSAVLDADDVWRVSEDLKSEENRPKALANVIAVMRGYCQAGCELAILSWVFARPELYEPVIDGLDDVVDSVNQVYLISTPDVLETRFRNRYIKSGNTFPVEPALDFSMSRLDLIEALPFQKIDTSEISSPATAEQVISLINQK